MTYQTLNTTFYFLFLIMIKKCQQKNITCNYCTTKLHNQRSNSLKSTETHYDNNLTPQNIDLISNPSQVKKEKDVALKPDECKKGTALAIGDSMLAGLREAKLSWNKKIKVRFFLVQKLRINNTI